MSRPHRFALGATLAAGLFAGALLFAAGPQTRAKHEADAAKPEHHSPLHAALPGPPAADGREGPSGLGPHDVYHGFGRSGRFALGSRLRPLLDLVVPFLQ
jgi:hypothetical protein